MPMISYVPHKFRAEALAIIERANAICVEYQAMGFNLTLRQLYYQFVARDIIRNRQSEYKRLGDIINDARLAGLIDWNHLEDRTRNVSELAHWGSPQSIIEACADQYRVDKWRSQPRCPIVMIEKDALVGVIEGVCQANDVPFFSCRGYTSQSEMWSMGQRLLRYVRGSQEPIILHLGDHDPSGIDMTRDITDRLSMFMGRRVELQRLALNMDQVQQWNPPSNPAKDTDARFMGYLQEYGDECWELDALDPLTLSGLVEDAILAVRDDRLWEEALDEEETAKKGIALVANHWTAALDLLDGEMSMCQDCLHAKNLHEDGELECRSCPCPTYVPEEELEREEEDEDDRLL